VLLENFEGFGPAVERIFSRAANHPRWWIAVWITAILGATVAAVVCHAPSAAYAVLFVLAVMVVFTADGRHRGDDQEKVAQVDE
jgi:hypothetical protein